MGLAKSASHELNLDQKSALEILEGKRNVFLTGAAGSGKSFLLRAFLKDREIPILASTGAAAILVGGRTFHSFFGLGILPNFRRSIHSLKRRNGPFWMMSGETVVFNQLSCGKSCARVTLNSWMF